MFYNNSADNSSILGTRKHYYSGLALEAGLFPINPIRLNSSMISSLLQTSLLGGALYLGSKRANVKFLSNFRVQKFAMTYAALASVHFLASALLYTTSQFFNSELKSLAHEGNLLTKQEREKLKNDAEQLATAIEKSGGKVTGQKELFRSLVYRFAEVQDPINSEVQLATPSNALQRRDATLKKSKNYQELIETFLGSQREDNDVQKFAIDLLKELASSKATIEELERYEPTVGFLCSLVLKNQDAINEISNDFLRALTISSADEATFKHQLKVFEAFLSSIRLQTCEFSGQKILPGKTFQDTIEQISAPLVEQISREECEDSERTFEDYMSERLFPVLDTIVKYSKSASFILKEHPACKMDIASIILDLPNGSLMTVSTFLNQILPNNDQASLNETLQNGETILTYLIHEDRYHGLINPSLLKKFDLNAEDARGHTPLMAALVHGGKTNDYRIFEMLLELGVDPNIQNRDGKTALHFLIEDAAVAVTLIDGEAVVNLSSVQNVIQTLLKHKANPKIEDKLSQAPYDTLQKYPRFLKEAQTAPSGDKSSTEAHFRRAGPGHLIEVENLEEHHIYSAIDKVYQALRSRAKPQTTRETAANAIEAVSQRLKIEASTLVRLKRSEINRREGEEPGDYKNRILGEIWKDLKGKN